MNNERPDTCQHKGARIELHVAFRGGQPEVKSDRFLHRLTIEECDRVQFSHHSPLGCLQAAREQSRPVYSACLSQSAGGGADSSKLAEVDAAYEEGHFNGPL